MDAMTHNRRELALMVLAFFSFPQAALAVTERSAIALVSEVVAELTRIANAGQPKERSERDIKNMFGKYGHVAVIARYVLGPDARNLSAAKFAEYQDALAGYMARKYARRLLGIVGSNVEIAGARRRKKFVEVRTLLVHQGGEPFEIDYMVSDYDGRARFHDMSLEGISLLVLERTEVQAILNEHRGNVDKLIAVLRRS